MVNFDIPGVSVVGSILEGDKAASLTIRGQFAVLSDVQEAGNPSFGDCQLDRRVSKDEVVGASGIDRNGLQHRPKLITRRSEFLIFPPSTLHNAHPHSST